MLGVQVPVVVVVLVVVGAVHPVGIVRVIDEPEAKVLAAGAVKVYWRMLVVEPATTDAVVAVMVPWPLEAAVAVRVCPEEGLTAVVSS